MSERAPERLPVNLNVETMRRLDALMGTRVKIKRGRESGGHIEEGWSLEEQNAEYEPSDGNFYVTVRKNGLKKDVVVEELIALNPR